MATGLTLLMPVLPGTKLLTIVELLAANQAAIDAALESIGTVHFARFSLLDRSKGNLQPDMSNINTPSDTLVIGVITEYDGSFNAYISDFVNQLGNVFNALLAYVVGGAAVTPVQSNLAAFQAFVAANDASQHLPNNAPIYEAYTQTVQMILAAFPSNT
jgi:hypothetical protein